MWIYITIGIIFLAALIISIETEEICFFVLGLLCTLIPFVASIPPTITECDYKHAKEAVYILERIDTLTLDNVGIVEDCLNTLDRYQEDRDKIEANCNNKWNGKMYEPENLEKYPEVHLDENILNKFR